MAERGRLRAVIVADDEELRHQSADAIAASLSLPDLLTEAADLETFRRKSDNLYHRVRALLFLMTVHRYHVPRKQSVRRGEIPPSAVAALLERRFEEAIRGFLKVQDRKGPSDAISSALAAAYRGLAFQTLSDQVRRSVRSVRGNQWMFRITHPQDQPLRVRADLCQRTAGRGPFPILRERTPVRMDLSHSAWSDIFFLGMDYPEGARVLNISIDLGVHGRDRAPLPPIESYFRVIDEPVLRLTSIDLGACAEIDDLKEVFDFARDYLGLLKAAVIAAGLVPPGLDGCGMRMSDLLETVVGKGRGIEIASQVRGIPKGSRLAVSTHLLSSLIAVCMRATGQTHNLEGTLPEVERRTVAARAILGEWLGGSGGGWQDSGGLWPSVKLIEGCEAEPLDPEFGISRGRLLPRHTILDGSRAPPRVHQALEESLILVHGGMAQNVGPILEMVTEKYLLRCEREWRARKDALALMDLLLGALAQGDVKTLGRLTTRNFTGPIQTIIPWASNAFTERLIESVERRFAGDFWGFWMLGGMAGGGMGFLFDPSVRESARNALAEIMSATKKEMERAVPFAIEPLVYDFAINPTGTRCDVLTGEKALLPADYYTLVVPELLSTRRERLTQERGEELFRFAEACREEEELRSVVPKLFDRMLPRASRASASDEALQKLLDQHGFDRELHEQIRQDLRSGRIGLPQNRLPRTAVVEDAAPADVIESAAATEEERRLGTRAIENGEVAVVTLAAGTASRWTEGAGVVKALHPFCKLGGRHRSFLEVHLAKSRRTGGLAGRRITHVFTTSFVTHEPIAHALDRDIDRRTDSSEPSALVSQGRAVGLRLVPMVRDLKFAWEESAQQRLDQQAQKVRDSLHAALIGWAQDKGEGSDYRDNLPMQYLHPVGHWYEIPNLLRNGVLLSMLERQPRLTTLLMHNIDTLGASLDPALLGMHLRHGATLGFEVIARKLEDRGGGLGRIDGRLRLIEGLALPREDDEHKLTWYSTLTTWVDVDGLLRGFGLTRNDLPDEALVQERVRSLSTRLPTYVTLKDVKRRWGHGQEDVYPVSQFEKLWGDMSALPDISCCYFGVPRMRGQQLKEPGQLDQWVRDGSADHVTSLCEW